MPNYFDSTPPANPYPILPDYSSLGEALERAIEIWGAKEAQAKLVGQLLVVRPPTFASFETGKVERVDSRFWSHPGVNKDKVFREERYEGSSFRPSKWRPVFLTADLDKYLPGAPPPIGKIGTTVETRDVPPDRSNLPAGQKRRGRPTNPNIDDFWIEAARMVAKAEQGATGQTQDAFVAAMVAWANKLDSNPYAEDTIRDKIKRLWRELELGR